MFTIPAIDLRGGAVVRLFQGRFDRETRYGLDPIAVANRWRDQGAVWIHVVDLDGAVSGRPRQTELVRRMVSAVGGPIQVGGGLRTLADIDVTLGAGASRIILGSAALSAPDLVEKAVEQYGECVAVAIDARNGKVSVSGWQRDIALSPIKFARRLQAAGVVRVVHTDVARDGTMRGPSIDATRRIATATGLAVIASGGVSSLEDLRGLAQLRDVGVEGTIVGRALYEGRFTLREAVAAAGGGGG